MNKIKGTVEIWRNNRFYRRDLSISERKRESRNAESIVGECGKIRSEPERDGRIAGGAGITARRFEISRSCRVSMHRARSPRYKGRSFDWDVNENGRLFACRCRQISVILLHRGLEWDRAGEFALLPPCSGHKR